MSWKEFAPSVRQLKWVLLDTRIPAFCSSHAERPKIITVQADLDFCTLCTFLTGEKTEEKQTGRGVKFCGTNVTLETEIHLWSHSSSFFADKTLQLDSGPSLSD